MIHAGGHAVGKVVARVQRLEENVRVHFIANRKWHQTEKIVSDSDSVRP